MIHVVLGDDLACVDATLARLAASSDVSRVDPVSVSPAEVVARVSSGSLFAGPVFLVVDDLLSWSDADLVSLASVWQSAGGSSGGVPSAVACVVPSRSARLRRVERMLGDVLKVHVCGGLSRGDLARVVSGWAESRSVRVAPDASAALVACGDVSVVRSVLAALDLSEVSEVSAGQVELILGSRSVSGSAFTLARAVVGGDLSVVRSACEDVDVVAAWSLVGSAVSDVLCAVDSSELEDVSAKTSWGVFSFPAGRADARARAGRALRLWVEGDAAVKSSPDGREALIYEVLRVSYALHGGQSSV